MGKINLAAAYERKAATWEFRRARRERPDHEDLTQDQTLAFFARDASYLGLPRLQRGLSDKGRYKVE